MVWSIVAALGLSSAAPHLPSVQLQVNAIPAETPQSAPAHREMRKQFAEQCQKGRPDYCYHLGRLMKFGLGGPADPDGAQALFERSCRQHVASACLELDPKLIEVDVRKTYELGCHNGDQQFCYSLAGMLRSGRGGAPDLGRAERLFEAACSKGYEKACSEVKR